MIIAMILMFLVVIVVWALLQTAAEADERGETIARKRRGE